MAEMAERAQQISQEAGTKIAAAMKDVIGAAAGLAGFAVESARDLVQFMVRRGQMTQDEADKLIREAENAQSRRGGRASGSKTAQPEASAKLEKAAESGRREPAKAAATQAKRPSAASAAAKSEKKSSAKRDAAPKKPAAKSSTTKKRR
jgi:polyhydroxyalkanoate synthesis regulator phasin